MNLTAHDDQVECFRNVAAHMKPGGYFVIEVIVPALQQLPPGNTLRGFYRRLIPPAASLDGSEVLRTHTPCDTPSILEAWVTSKKIC
jgi:hypothetical protein